MERFRTPRRRLLADRLARWGVTGGGLTIIASILGILVFILIEVLPLFGGATVGPSELRVDSLGGSALVTDEYRTHVAVVDDAGEIRVARVADGEIVARRSLLPEGDEPVTAVAVGKTPGQPLFAVASSDGRLTAQPVGWEIRFDGDTRVVTPELAAPVVFEVGEPVSRFSVQIDEEGAALAAAQLADGRVALLTRSVETNMFTEETEESWSRAETTPQTPLSGLALDSHRRNLYGGLPDGSLLWWRIEDGEPTALEHVAGDSAVTTLSLLLGDRSLVVGREDGTIEIWFPVRDGEGGIHLTKIRDFPPLDGAVILLAPSLRNKGFLAVDEGGNAGLYYSTSKRVLWTGTSPVERPTALFYTPKADGAFFASATRTAALEIDNPHPEVSLRSFFGRVWYEGYDNPRYVWQSTGGSDDFEPKLSLTPLITGTLKGTVYSLFLAIPLGVLGAMFTSQFMSPELRRFVKPTVELMAALPSVVLGFLAGLWLAPRVEQVLPALALMLLVLPAIILLATLCWHQLPRSFRGRLPQGSEIWLYLVAVTLGAWICLELNAPLTESLFGGDVQGWLHETTGLVYDQRNAIVVGLAMGFAVIPIIFSIAEDAFSNVPRNLVSGSLALGADRWQTVTKIVLPTASPGIFSAIMIGFGRAVGETMIVLMATGNTPVLDWNPFNGFRTLSANIAVEIPEAPHGDTLYRTLFLAALILFVFTFLLNTVAEFVRQRLRKRYAEL